ncbi:hypothetical protein LTR15_005928 [Elasticomyces elasticus]|nr:hypothetical protein LTR15_005928 [Elasticomyces elasticus]
MGTPKKLRRPAYEKLDAFQQEIRLLVLKRAAQASDDIHCELRVVSLAKRPRPLYNTISYVWGDGKEKCTIHVDGRSAEIIASAEQVLRRFRLRDRDRTIWLDAICINQGDVEERGEQVALMNAIYTGSSHNLIWLGEDDGFMAQAVIDIKALYREACEETRGLSRLREVLYNIHGFRLSEQPFSTTLDLSGLLRLWERPWFLRLWVVQEAALPKLSSMYCGGHEVRLKLVLTAAAWLKHKLKFTTKMSPIVYKGLQCAMLMWEYTYRDIDDGPRSSLLLMLSGLGTLQARDPRDHIYGVLGLYQRLSACETIPSELTPDYNKSLEDVLKGVMTVAFTRIVETGRFENFGTLNLKPEDLGSADNILPSWVLRPHLPWDAQYNAANTRGDFRACGSKALSWFKVTGRDKSIMVLKGMTIRQVKHVEPVWTSDDFQLPDAVATKLIGFIETSNDHQADISSLPLTLIAGMDYQGNRPSHKEADASFRAVLRQLRLGPTPAEDEDAASLKIRQAKNDDYQRVMRVACGNRRLFVMQDCKIGMGPRVTQVGDVAAVLWGFKRPVLLRPLLGRKGYKLCDEVYIDHVLDGEWADAQLAKGRNEEVFHLH